MVDENKEKKVVIEIYMNKAMAVDFVEGLSELTGIEMTTVDWSEHGYNSDVYPVGFYEDEIITAVKDTFELD